MARLGAVTAFALVACAASALLLPGRARAQGAWQTFLRPINFTDLIAESDTVWCASLEGGLLRYTPSRRTFSSFVRAPGGLASNRIGCLAFDRSRRLWVGTFGAGASVLAPDRATWSLVNAFDGLPSDSVTVLEAQGDTMWIGTSRGFALWNGRDVEGRLPDGVNPSPFGSDFITGLAVLGDSLWVATNAGVYVGRLSRRFDTWTAVNDGLAAARAEGLASNGTELFVLSDLAVYRLDAATGRWSALTGMGSVRGLYDDRGAVFVAAGGGVFRWDGAAFAGLNPSLNSSSGARFAITEDETGRVYAAGRPASSADQSRTGLYRQPDGAGAWTFEFPPGPPGNDCLNLEVVGTRVYVNTYLDGVGRYDGGGWKNWFTSSNPVRGTAADTTFRQPIAMYALLADKLGRKWFGSWAPSFYPPNSLLCVADTGSIEVLDDAGAVPAFTHNLWGGKPDARHTYARASTLDSAGGVWFGMDSPCAEDPDLTPLGLEHYRADGSYAGSYNSGNTGGVLLSDQVWSLVTDRHQRVWIGTTRGIAYTDAPSPDAFPVFRFLRNTEQYSVRGLAAYGDTLWVMTTSEVRRYSTGGDYRSNYTVPGQPAPNSVRPIDVAPDGTLWIGTANGVRAYVPGELEPRNYSTKNSPLADDEVRTIRVDRRTGQVWMATATGVSRFDPAYVAPAPSLPSLHLRVYPNPARLTGAGLTLRLAGDGVAYRGAIYDLGGRQVQVFFVPANGRVVWNGRDRNGDLVHPGVYFVRAESAGRAAVARIAVVR